eukprot:jgi/Mesen1/8490/ME000480S07842
MTSAAILTAHFSLAGSGCVPIRPVVTRQQSNTALYLPLRTIRCEAVASLDAVDLVPLGKSSLRVSRLGTGTLQWGDPGTGFGRSYNEDSLAAAYDALVAGGINFFDSAEVYGYQSMKEGKSSEQMLARFAARGQTQAPPVLASKFFTIPWSNFLVGGGFRLGRQSLIAALRASLERMGRDKIDLYQIHFPFPTFSNSALMDALKEAVDLGLTTAVGVSNYNASQMEEAHRLLAASGIPLASNQVRYSLLSRQPEEDGLLRVAQIQPLLRLMASVGAQHGGKSVSQVALNYLVCKGAIPIPACKTVEQAKSHVGVLGWHLDPDEVDSLEGKVKALSL